MFDAAPTSKMYCDAIDRAIAAERRAEIAEAERDALAEKLLLLDSNLADVRRELESMLRRLSTAKGP